MISEPISLLDLKNGIENDEFETLKDFLDSMQKIWDNTKLYSQNDSKLHFQSLLLEKYS